MQIGKLAEPALKRSVLRQLYDEPQKRAYRCGADCAVVSAQDGILRLASVVSEVPGFAQDSGKLVLAAANNLEAAGARPETFLVSAVLPPDVGEDRLRQDMCRIRRMAEQCAGQPAPKNTGDACDAQMCSGKNAAADVIAGGHTQISPAVQSPLYTVTGLGRAKEEDCRLPVFLKPGDTLLVTGAIALGGTAALALAHGEELRRRYPFSLVDRAEHMEEQMPVRDAARAITGFGPAAVHDLSQGGIFSALWEMAERAGVGLDVDLKRIPIRQETVEICEYFDVNPYYLYSAGALLVGIGCGEALAAYLASQGIQAAVIGRVTEGPGRIIRNGEDRRYLDRPRQDEWYRMQRQQEMAELLR